MTKEQELWLCRIHELAGKANVSLDVAETFLRLFDATIQMEEEHFEETVEMAENMPITNQHLTNRHRRV